jgi:hypothetical protein
VNGKFTFVPALLLLLSAGIVPLGAQESFDDVTPIGELNRMNIVTVAGTVVFVDDDDEVIIEDASGRAEIVLPERGRLGNLRPGDLRRGTELLVRGRLDYDISDRIPEIYAVEIELDDGRIVLFDRTWLDRARSDRGWSNGDED